LIKEQGFLKSERSLFFYWNCDRRTEPQATKKFFGAAVFQKCCRGVGEQPTFAKQIRFCNLFSLLQLHLLKLSHSNKVAS